MVRAFASLGLCAFTVAFATGCGADDRSAAGPAADPKLAALLPPESRGGEVTVGVYPVIPPMEFKDDRGDRVVGSDIELLDDLAARLGLRTRIAESGFDGLIPGLQSGRFDLAVASMFDTAERRVAVDFLDYLRLGAAFYFRKGAAPVNSLSDTCGRTAGVVKGSVYDVILGAQAKKCPAARPLKVLTFEEQPAVNAALDSGRIEFSAIDEPIAIWAVKQSGGRFSVSERRFGVSNVGMAFANGSRLIPAFKAALDSAMADGTYLRILRKWGLKEVAIPRSRISR